MQCGDAEAFVAAIKSRFDDPKNVLTDSVEWVGGGVGTDGNAVVLYREYFGGPLLGRRYDVAKFAARFHPPCSIEQLADIAIADEITDPTGRGVTLSVDWAKGFAPEGASPEWVGELYQD